MDGGFLIRNLYISSEAVFSNWMNEGSKKPVGLE
jgi:hypothetical protein